MKKNLSIILIFVFLSNIVGSYILFNILQNNIQRAVKHQIRRGLKDDELTIIPANDIENIHWIKADKEFKYKGEMYDIVKIKHNKIKKYYYCIWDKKEKKLIADYNKIHQNTRTRHRQTNKLVRIQLFFQNITTKTFLTSSDMLFIELICKLTKCYIRIPSPPPKTL